MTDATRTQSTPEVVEQLERIASLLEALYTPAGALIWFAARNRTLGGDSPAEMYRRGDVDGLRRAADRLNALADGAFA